MNMKRIYAGGIDFIITSIIQSILMFTFFITPIMNNTLDENQIFARMLMITYCSMMFMIIRDIIGKKSIGKRIFKLKIIDKNTGNEANFAKRLLRNITWLLGPWEIIILLISKKRLGDYISGTEVVEI